MPPRITRLTGARSQPRVTAKLPAVDSNHDRRAQNAASYQLDERALVRAAQFERALDRIRAGCRLPFGLRPRAPPGSRSPFSGLRVQCITCHACGAQSGQRESNPRYQLGSLLLCH